MNYELAKQLKDAGFPQDTLWNFIDGDQKEVETSDHFEVVEGEWGSCRSMKDIEFVSSPTLEELIDVCGDTFKQLNFHLMERQAGYGICTTPDEGIVDMNKFGRWTARARLGKGHENHKKQWGKTPIEAVAKLWLELHAKV